MTAAISAPSSTRPRRHSPFSPASLPAYRYLALMAALTLALIAVLGFGVDGHDLPLMAMVGGYGCAVAFALRRFGHGRWATAVEAMVLVCAASILTACLSVLFATTALPLRDEWLAAADRVVWPFFTWTDMYGALHHRSSLVTAMTWVYKSLQWQPFVLVAVLALSGRERTCWRFVHAWFAALALCLVVFPFVTAATPYVHYRIALGDIPALSIDISWRVAALLGRIHAGAVHELVPSELTGLITMPSFHAAAAVLLIRHYRDVPIIGKPFIALNVAMIASTPLIGAHYYCDILGGAVVALIALRIAGPAREAVAVRRRHATMPAGARGSHVPRADR